MNIAIGLCFALSAFARPSNEGGRPDCEEVIQSCAKNGVHAEWTTLFGRWSVLRIESPHCDSRTEIRSAPPCAADINNIKAIVLTATPRTNEKAVLTLAGRRQEVSAHLTILCDGTILWSVPFEARAWLAGKGGFGGLEKTNSAAHNLNAGIISIFLVNSTHMSDDGTRIYAPYTKKQLRALETLLPVLVEKYKINPACIWGIGDVAFQKHQAPYHTFYKEWKKLGESGFGLWVTKKEIAQARQRLRQRKRKIDNDLCYDLLYALGYTWARESAAECDAVVRQIQRHFLCAGAPRKSEKRKVTGLDKNGNIPQEVCELALALCIKYRDLPWVMSRASKNAQALLQACIEPCVHFPTKKH